MVLYTVWYHLYNLKKHEKHPWRTVTFSNTQSKSSTPPPLLHGCFSRFFKLYKWYQIAQSIAFNGHKPLAFFANKSITDVWYGPKTCLKFHMPNVFKINTKVTIRIGLPFVGLKNRHAIDSSRAFIVYFEQINHMKIVFVFLTLRMTFFSLHCLFIFFILDI